VPEHSCDLGAQGIYAAVEHIGDDVARGACSDCCGYFVEHAKITFGYRWLTRTQNSTTRTQVDGSTRKSSHRISENQAALGIDYPASNWCTGSHLLTGTSLSSPKRNFGRIPQRLNEVVDHSRRHLTASTPGSAPVKRRNCCRRGARTPLATARAQTPVMGGLIPSVHASFITMRHHQERSQTIRRLLVNSCGIRELYYAAPDGDF